MPFFIIEQDITKMNTDCIVISADYSLHPVGGISTAVFQAVDDPKGLTKECAKIGYCGGCECATTNSYGLPAKYIIHAVAPVLADSGNRGEEYLKICYDNALMMARRKMFESLSLPLLGTGKKGYSKDVSLKIAINAITDFLEKYDMNIYLVIHNKFSFIPDKQLMENVGSYIKLNFNNAKEFVTANSFVFDFTLSEKVTVNFTGTENSSETQQKKETAEKVNSPHNSVPFSKFLTATVKQKRFRDSKLCKKCNIEKYAFARLKNHENKIPTKEEVLAIAIGCRMNLQEAEKFVENSGYSLNTDSKQNVIIRYFIENNIYDISKINQILFYYSQPQLGAVI